MNVIILAGGLGTRFEDLNVFPKILMPTPTQDSILSAHAKFFALDNLFLVINTEYYDMVKEYCDINHINIKILPTTVSTGSYNTLASVNDLIPHDDVMLVWSDLELYDIDWPSTASTNNIIYTCDSGDYRYVTDGTHISESDHGNIPGVFYFSHIPHLNVVTGEYDLVQWMKDNTMMKDNVVPYTTRQAIVTEYRDKDIYIKLMSAAHGDENKPRFFNNLFFEKNVVIKGASDMKYNHLIQKEVKWYDALNFFGLTDIAPQIIYRNTNNNSRRCSFTMEYLDGYIPLYRALIEADTTDGKIMILDKVMSQLDRMHIYKKSISARQVEDDIYREIVGKTLDRCDSISHILLNYDREELKNMLMDCFNIMIKHYHEHGCDYVFGHGDTNGSNVMVRVDPLDVKFIDPRGYFGYTEGYILKDYETAKLLYCLSGYDQFNINPQVFGVNEPVSIADPSFIIDSMDPDYIYLMQWLAVIWINLAGYISQDVMKANIAYNYGKKLLKSWL